jgi:nicotinamide-nucleotide amidase
VGALAAACALDALPTTDAAAALARALRRQAGTHLALAVLVEPDAGEERVDFGGHIQIAIATGEGERVRRSRLVGGREWLRNGAAEMALDCLRRHLAGLPVDEQIDFEKKAG